MTPPMQFSALSQHDVALNIHAIVDFIASLQHPDGSIAWSLGDKTDPWDHVESAIGLTIGGALPQARLAYQWLVDTQRVDGSWYAAYTNGRITDRTRETNHAAYIAVGAYHYYLTTGDIDFLAGLWPTVQRAIDFVLRHQTPTGEIYWAVSPEGAVDAMALITGCSSICFSLKCALAIAKRLQKNRPQWRQALHRLTHCLQNRPHRFNKTKARYSMDWFYPVLCGVITGQDARQRIDNGWKKFVVQDLGVRCVSDHPWVTVAESCELILALAAIGNYQKAAIVFRWISDHLFDDHTFWCGFTFPDMVVWPEEKISWTNAVVLMAADALFNLTPAGNFFHHDFWQRLEL